jgi:hypothetical protein
MTDSCSSLRLKSLDAREFLLATVAFTVVRSQFLPIRSRLGAVII